MDSCKKVVPEGLVKPPPVSDKFLGVESTARYLDKTRQTIHRWRVAGLFPKPDGIDPFGKPAWKVSTLDAFMRERLEVSTPVKN